MESPRKNAALPAGDLLSARPNRRWSVRQKIHTPAYISVNPCEDGTIFGLNEVFDIGTGGLSFQSPETLVPGSRVSLNLELSGAEDPVRATGRVIWSDLTGRTGIQLRRSSLSAPRRLDEYLFLNAITACAHYDALQSGSADAGHHEQLLEPVDLPWDSAEETREVFPGYPALLTCLSEIKEDVEGTVLTLDSLCQALAARTSTFLQASGVAIALAGEDEIICRASTGSAPGVGTQFQAGSGFSGECIQSGVLLRCDDTESDPRVDHGACLALGIRSILAAPIHSHGRVTGLIEVFSAQPNAFNRNSRIFLQRLAEMVGNASSDSAEAITESNLAPAGLVEVRKPPLLRTGETVGSVQSDDLDPLVLTSAPEIPDISSRRQRILLLSSAAVLLLVATLIMPWIRTIAGKTHQSKSGIPAESFRHPIINPSEAAVPASELQNLRQLAKAGDANAQFALGVRYATGDEVVQDYSTAARWFSLAADQGHVVAQATLGAYYWAGRGVPENLQKAYFWSVLAEAGGDEGSKFRLASLASSLSREDVILAQEEANEWLRQHQLASRAAASHP